VRHTNDGTRIPTEEADMTNTNDKAAALRALHVPGTPVVLPNAWDAASARAIERAGYAGVATSSAAISDTLGWDDGEAIPVEEMLAAATRIARSVTVPVTLDLERGYRLDAAELVEGLARTGAVGLNLEDSDPATGTLLDIEAQASFLAGVREAAAVRGLDVVINARTDAFLRQWGTPEQQLETSIARGNRYLQAGADCVYPLGVQAPSAIRTLAAEIAGAVNIARALQGPLTVMELASMGVARVTFGPGLQRKVYAAFEHDLLPTLAT
jgi:2-methylisocitrate lyase-like PEP mutase family enzyme